MAEMNSNPSKHTDHHLSSSISAIYKFCWDFAFSTCDTKLKDLKTTGNFNKTICANIEATQCLWSFLVIHGPLMSFLVFCGHMSSFMIFCGLFWLYVVLHGPSWTFMVRRGPMWSLAVLMVYPVPSLCFVVFGGFCASSWSFMILSGLSLSFMVLHGIGGL